jgi:hypothetical protein
VTVEAGPEVGSEAIWAAAVNGEWFMYEDKVGIQLSDPEPEVKVLSAGEVFIVLASLIKHRAAHEGGTIRDEEVLPQEKRVPDILPREKSGGGRGVGWERREGPGTVPRKDVSGDNSDTGVREVGDESLKQGGEPEIVCVELSNELARGEGEARIAGCCNATVRLLAKAHGGTEVAHDIGSPVRGAVINYD